MHVLYVDGHDSHVTQEFIEHCYKHKIRVPSYPAHGMHIYQTLDVSVFSLLKLDYGKHRDQHETGEAIMKENFMERLTSVFSNLSLFKWHCTEHFEEGLPPHPYKGCNCLLM